jgi:hypothetical protein
MPQRLAVVVGASIAAVAFVASPASATTTNYWGYNNLTASNPPAGTCPGSIAGIACSGWNNWDYSQADWNSGSGSFVLGFICSSDGLLHGRVISGTPNTYTDLWSSDCPTHYNKAAVAHYSGTYNYLQARALIFP